MKNVTIADKRAFSIPQFCSAYGISRAGFYNLKKSGQVPDVINLGGRRIITITAVDEWEARMMTSTSQVTA